MNEFKLVIGSRNRKKSQELAELFQPLGLNVLSLADVKGAVIVDETGSTFAENAALKATLQAKALGMWVLADDSGLEVDALAGRPGVRSARYAGENATDEDNYRLLLSQLENVPPEKRTARFVCHMVLADPAGKVRAEARGICRGRIISEPRGTDGFGYDPVFEIVEYHRTFAELGSVVKACISHRGRAARQLIPQLVRLIDEKQWQ